MTLVGCLCRFCAQTDICAHIHSHALLPLSHRVTFIPQLTLTQTGVPCQEQRVFPFGSLCTELTFIPPEVDVVLFGSGLNLTAAVQAYVRIFFC